MMDNNFLKLLKSTAKEQSLLGEQRLIPEKLSGLANYVATHLWQSILFMAFISTSVWNLLLLNQ